MMRSGGWLRRAGGGQRRLLVGCLLAAAFVLSAATGTAAQEGAPGTAGDAELELLRVDAEFPPQVWLEVAVIGGPAGTLGPDNFLVTGTEPGTGVVVRPVSTVGMKVVLVVDTSGSMAGQAMEQARAAAASFVGKLPPGTEVAVVSAGAGSPVLLGLTSDHQAALDVLATLTARGETAVHDAAVAAVDLLGAADAEDQRFVVMLTDGADTVSERSLEEALAAVAEADVTFHGVALDTSEGDTSSLWAFAEVASVSTVIAAADSAALETAFGRVGDTVVGRYEVIFTAAAGAQPTIALVGGDAVAVSAWSLSGPVAASPSTEGGVRPPADDTSLARPVDVPVPALIVGPEPTGLAGYLALPLGLSLIGGALLLGLVVVGVKAGDDGGSARPQRSLSLLDDRRTPTKRGLGALPDLFDAVLGRFVKARRMNQLLEKAGLPWRAGEYLVMVVGVSTVSGLAGALLLGHWLGLLGAFGGPTLGRLYLLRRAELRKKAFGEQLHGTLQLLAGNLRVGHALLSALDSVAEESEAPTSVEFHRVVGEVRLGRPLGAALRAMAERLDSPDLQWVAEAVDIQRDVGGDLAEVLDNVAETLAEKARLEGHVAALAADGKMSAAVMMALPVVVATLMSITQPAYLLVFVERTGGRILAVAALALMAAGGIWLKKLITLVY